MLNAERRKADRVKDGNLSLKLQTGNFDTVTRTLNISTSGLYCKVDRELPVMSRIDLMLMLPNFAKKTEEVQPLAIEGVVVRAHPVIVNGKIAHYDIAIFFDSLNSEAKNRIANYISHKRVA